MLKSSNKICKIVKFIIVILLELKVLKMIVYLVANFKVNSSTSIYLLFMLISNREYHHALVINSF